MKWLVFDMLFGVWILPFCLILVVTAAIVARPGGGWPMVTDNSSKHEARIAEAHAREAEARAAEAHGIAIGEAHQAWAGNLPLILLVGGGITSVVMGAYWRGRNQNECIRQSGAIQQAQIEAKGPHGWLEANQPAQPVNQHLTVNILPENMLAMLEQYAQAHGKQLQTDGSDYYLVDNHTGEAQRVKPKGLLKG